MQLIVDDWESMAPVLLHPPLMTDEEFVAFCGRYPDSQIECNAEGEISIMPPSYSEGGFRSGEIFGQLRN
jgi:Uma2 family endonuclease